MTATPALDRALPTSTPTAAGVDARGVLDGGLRFEVRVLETPHTLVLTCDPAAGAFDARWTVPPLGATRLRRLRCPQPRT